ncbi:MAG: Ppx/GppA family phosphatase [Ignavibacteria bacterium]|nr:Ppx/GppA family phosphatase [Ignavibacteria bacterium]
MRSGGNKVYSVIDLGTNTCLLLTASVEGSGLTALNEVQEIPRIGKGIYDTGLIARESFERAAEVFLRYRRLSEEYGAGKIFAFGTSALRDAKNSEEFISYIMEMTGIQINVISGRQEAECAYLGAVYDIGSGEHAVLDIGGGSTELSFIESGILINESANIGSVRITDMFFRNGYTESALAEAEKFISAGINKLPLYESERQLVGVAGTMTTLSAIKLGLNEFDFSKIHGDSLSFEEVRSIAGKLFRMSEGERKELGSFMEGRSDIITAGAVILRIFMEKLKAESIIVSAKGLRYGLMLNIDAFSKNG